MRRLIISNGNKNYYGDKTKANEMLRACNAYVKGNKCKKKFLVTKLKPKYELDDLGVYGRIILKLIVKKQGRNV
jgi:hypothetical protein